MASTVVVLSTRMGIRRLHGAMAKCACGEGRWNPRVRYLALYCFSHTVLGPSYRKKGFPGYPCGVPIAAPSREMDVAERFIPRPGPLNFRRRAPVVLWWPGDFQGSSTGRAPITAPARGRAASTKRSAAAPAGSRTWETTRCATRVSVGKDAKGCQTGRKSGIGADGFERHE